MPRFKADDLLPFCQALLAAAGLPSDEARLVGKMLVDADLNGYPGHGVAHAVSYIDWIQTGVIQLAKRPEVLHRGRATALMDGHFYFGQIVADEATRLAIQMAGEHGTGTVCVYHSGHIGRLADFMERIASADMIGIAAVSVGGRSIASYGSMESFGGTNPMGYGVPRRSAPPILLDFATAASSMAELRRKARQGETIPAGMLLDGTGQPTTDFKKFIGPPRGVVLPFGGYKGSGLHLMAEILGGVLTGNGLGKEWWDRGGPAINGLMIQAIRIEEFLPLDEFYDKLEELVAWIKSRKAAPGFPGVVLPGENSRARAARQIQEGIEIETAVWEELSQRASTLGVRHLPRPLASNSS